MKTKFNKSTFLLTLVPGLFTSCQSKKQEEVKQNLDGKPNIILIVTDDHGRDDAGCYGNTAIKTPNLDLLAKNSVRFTNAYCTSASCSASRSVILTGMYNHANGQYGHSHSYHHFSAFNSIKSLPVMLEESGYATARIGKYHVAPEEVFHFQTVLNANSRNAVAMTDSCKGFIKENKDNPFFLYYCTSDPHRGGGVVEDNPYKPNRFANKDEGYPGVETVKFDPDSVIVPEYLPNTAACREELAQYYQSVSRFDQGLGKLFRFLKDEGLYENSIIIYISDNGIAFPGAKTTLYDPGMHLPLIVKAPGVLPNSESDAMVTWADITPTILDFAGVLEEKQTKMQEDAENTTLKSWEYKKPEEAFHGRSFKSVVETGSSDGWDEIYASHTFHEITMYYPMRVVQTRDYKLIWNIAHGLPYPHASDLWVSATWQSVLNSPDQMYAHKSIKNYNYRPKFELFDMRNDPEESTNLAYDPKYAAVMEELKAKLKAFQERTNDPWILKWERE